MKIIQGHDHFHNPLNYSLTSKQQGKKELIQDGWKQQSNPGYFEKDGVHTHFNSRLHIWIFEE